MTSPIPRASVSVPATDPRHQQALDDWAALYGFRAEQTLLPTHWAMFEIDGHAEVCLNASGVRALALLAPRPDAQLIAEQIIAKTYRGGATR